jgi:hypothetical protein
MLHKSNTKFPFKTMYFFGVWRLTTSSCIAYDYTTRGHTDCRVYMYCKYSICTFLYSIHTFIYSIFNSL